MTAGAGWAYVALLALTGLTSSVLAVREGRSTALALVRLAATGVLVWAVLAFGRGADVGLGFAAALFAAVLVLAHKSAADAQDARRLGLGVPGRIGVVLHGLIALPAVAMGGLALWTRHGS